MRRSISENSVMRKSVYSSRRD